MASLLAAQMLVGKWTTNVLAVHNFRYEQHTWHQASA